MADNVHTLDPALRRELIHLDPTKITVDLITHLFGYSTKAKPDGSRGVEVTEPVYRTNTKIHLNAGEYINKTAVDTNCGIILFNKLLIENKIEEFIPNGFFNEVVTKKTFSKILGYVSKAYMNKKISLNSDNDPRFYNFLRAYEFWSLRLAAIFSPSYTLDMIVPKTSVTKAKNAELKSAPPKTLEDMAKFEDKLVKMAKTATEGDPGRALFDSGSRGSFENDYKNMSIMVGPVENPVTGEFDLMTSNYIDGITKEDLVAAGNIVVNSEYPKAIGTARGGYITKQFYAGLQSIVLDEPGTDCGTKVGLRIKMTADDADQYIDQYILEDGKNILLTEENIAKYYGRVVTLRSPQFCISKKRCNICMGERYYKTGTTTVGLTATRISNNLMQKNLKLRHSMKVSLNRIDPKTVLVKSKT